MLNAVWWLIAVELIALAVFPLAYHLLPSLRDRGYSVSKPLGLLLIGYVSWILSQVHLVPSTRISLSAMVLALACVSGWLAWRRRADLLLLLKKEWRVIALAEAVFLVFFVVWTLYRASDPSIDHTEQPMDFAFLNAAIQSVTGPPLDPWLSGESVSYYYFGYWMMGALTELTGIASNVSYNLAMALIPAMAAQAVFGLTFSIVRSQTERVGTAVAAGAAAVLLLGVAANLEGVFEFMRANAIGSQGFWDWLGIKNLDGALEEPTAGWYPQEFWWWFRATRVINTFDGDRGARLHDPGVPPLQLRTGRPPPPRDGDPLRPPASSPLSAGTSSCRSTDAQDCSDHPPGGDVPPPARGPGALASAA